MAVEVNHLAMGYITVTTVDKYDNTNTYEFRKKGGVAQPKDGYTPVVLKALWQEGIPVDWDPDELTASQRAEIDGFCDDCGTPLRSKQVAADEYIEGCPECDQEVLA